MSDLFPVALPGWQLVYGRLLSHHSQRATAYRQDEGWRAWVDEVGVLAETFATPEDAQRAADRAMPYRLVQGEGVLDDDGNLVILPHPKPVRDPRVDPRRGDVVQSQDAFGRNRFRVLGVGLDLVRYWSYRDDDELTCTLDEWREHASSDTVVSRG